MDGNQISDQIVQAINIIAEKKIEAISFDTTIEATIIDDSRASEGIYMVSNGSASFEAVSTETGYKTNDAVLVTIPQGDYSKQKIIAGKQVNKTDNSPIVYKSPFKTILNITNNLIGDTSKIGEVGMIANHPNEYCWDVNTKNFTDSIAYTQTYKVKGEDKIFALIWDSEDSLSEGEFNHTQIGIKAQFSTWLEEYGVVSGNYGLAVEIFFTHKDDVMSINAGNTNITQDIIDSHSFSKIIYLDSDSFFGNVYNFESYYTQEKTYDISEYTDFPITRIRLFAYQRNNFKDINDNKVEYEEDFNSTDSFSSIMPNIFIKDPYICLGISAETFSEDFATIVTKSNESYTAEFPVIPILEETEDIKLDENGLIKASSRRKNEFFRFLNKIYISKKGNYTHSRTIALFNALTLLETIDEGKIEINSSKAEEIATTINEFAKKHTPKDVLDNDNKAYPLLRLNNDKPLYLYEQTPYYHGDTNQPELTKADILASLLSESNLSFNNKKEIVLRWVHKNENTDIIQSVQDVMPEDYHVFWYVYRVGAPSPDNLMGAHWERFYGCVDTLNENEDKEKLISEKGSYLIKQEYDDVTDKTSVEFYPNTLREKELICAVIAKQEGIVDSLGSDDFTYRFITKTQPIEFINKTDVILQRASEQAQIDFNALSIKFEDKEKGNYFIYDRAGEISNEQYSKEIRFLQAVFDTSETDVNNKPKLENCKSIIWKIPASDSMIIPYTTTRADRKSLRNIFINSDSYEVSTDLLSSNESNDSDDNKIIYTIRYESNSEINNLDYYIFEQNGQFYNDEILNRICFSIENKLSQKNRNTIYLEIQNVYGQTYTAQVKLLFGTAGSSGSQYTIIVDWDNNSNGVFDINEESIQGTVKLLNKENNEVILNSDAKFEYSWSQAKCTGITKTTPRETKSLYYPVIINESNNKTYLQPLVNNNDNDIAIGKYYFSPLELDPSQEYFYYDLEEGVFKKIIFTNNNAEIEKVYENILKDNSMTQTVTYKRIYPYEAAEGRGTLSSVFIEQDITEESNDFRKETNITGKLSSLNNTPRGRSFTPLTNTTLITNLNNNTEEKSLTPDIFDDELTDELTNEIGFFFDLLNNYSNLPSDVIKTIEINQKSTRIKKSPTDFSITEDITVNIIDKKDEISVLTYSESGTISATQDFTITSCNLEQTFNMLYPIQVVSTKEKIQYITSYTRKINTPRSRQVYTEENATRTKEIYKQTFVDGDIQEEITSEINNKIKNQTKSVSFNDSDACSQYILQQIQYKRYMREVGENENTNLLFSSLVLIENNKLTLYQRSNGNSDFKKLNFKPFFKVNDKKEKKNNKFLRLNAIKKQEDNNLIFNYYNCERAGESGSLLGRRKAFIKYNDIYIIDPYDEYYDTLEYYYPVEASEKEYTNTTLKVSKKENSNNDSKFIIQKTNELSMDDLYILQVKLTNFGDYDLISNFSIPLRFSNITQESNSKQSFFINGIEGPTEIRYTTSGEVDYKEDPYSINITYLDKGEWKNDQIKDENLKIEIISEEQKDNNISFPLINIVKNKYKFLSPPSVYFKDNPFYGICFSLNQDLGPILKDTVLWTQPILVYEDNYPSTTLNQWSGQKIITDSDKGVIVAKGFSAGKKENDNTFTGVVIGDWSKDKADSMITKQTGIYGFNHGKMSYALKDDGTAFFGRDGQGRIYFNGNNARIYSSLWIASSLKNNSDLNLTTYKQNQEGMMLDIDDGKLLIQKNYIYTDITSDNQKFTELRKISIDSTGFFISNTNYETEKEIKTFELSLKNKDMVGNNINYALRTPDYNYQRKDAGMEINLGNQVITSFRTTYPGLAERNFKLQVGGESTTGIFQGYKCVLDCGRQTILRIGTGVDSQSSSVGTTNFSVDIYGNVKCQSIKIDDNTLRKAWVYVDYDGKLQKSYEELTNFKGIVCYIIE